MSFGSPTPVEVAVSGPKLADNRAYAEKVRERADQDSVAAGFAVRAVARLSRRRVKVDRQLAGPSGVTIERRRQFAWWRRHRRAASSSRSSGPIRTPASATRCKSSPALPDEFGGGDRHGSHQEQGQERGRTVAVRDVAQITEAQGGRRIRPLQHAATGEHDRQHRGRRTWGGSPATSPVPCETVNQSLWSQAQDAEGKQGWKNAITGEFVESPTRPTAPPRGLQVDVRGQVVPMQQMFGALGGGGFFEGMTIGLIMAVVVIFLLLTAYFQSVRLALASVSTVPAVFAGASICSWATGTRLNIQSLVGLIMASGVAAANAILLTTFAERIRREGKPATEAAKKPPIAACGPC